MASTLFTHARVVGKIREKSDKNEKRQVSPDRTYKIIMYVRDDCFGVHRKTAIRVATTDTCSRVSLFIITIIIIHTLLCAIYYPFQQHVYLFDINSSASWQKRTTAVAAASRRGRVVSFSNNRTVFERVYVSAG